MPSLHHPPTVVLRMSFLSDMNLDVWDVIRTGSRRRGSRINRVFRKHALGVDIETILRTEIPVHNLVTWGGAKWLTSAHAKKPKNFLRPICVRFLL